MLITLSGVTGSGKSFFKKQIQERLGLDNQIIYTTSELNRKIWYLFLIGEIKIIIK